MSDASTPNAQPNSHPPAPRLATSQDIPRAIEFLINFVGKWTFLAIASLLAPVAVIAFLRGWPWFVLYPALALAISALLFSFTFRPKGKFHFDRRGPGVIVPGVIVPRDKSAPSVAALQETTPVGVPPSGGMRREQPSLNQENQSRPTSQFLPPQPEK